ncbi:hypothetical protein KM043_008591 [Ampulex compressa]|nr:hypothetical protein KM043_008591 [Ampulex compressa]
MAAALGFTRAPKSGATRDGKERRNRRIGKRQRPAKPLVHIPREKQESVDGQETRLTPRYERVETPCGFLGWTDPCLGPE